jgi:membrane-associated phospholipid phosphatase
VTRRRIVQLIAILYPLTVLLIIIATGNHFFLDAIAGALVAALAAASAYGLTRRAPAPVLVPVASSEEVLRPVEQQAA